MYYVPYDVHYGFRFQGRCKLSVPENDADVALITLSLSNTDHFKSRDTIIGTNAKDDNPFQRIITKLNNLLLANLFKR